MFTFIRICYVDPVCYSMFLEAFIKACLQFFEFVQSAFPAIVYCVFLLMLMVMMVDGMMMRCCGGVRFFLRAASLGWFVCWFCSVGVVFVAPCIVAGLVACG